MWKELHVQHGRIILAGSLLALAFALPTAASDLAIEQHAAGIVDLEPGTERYPRIDEEDGVFCHHRRQQYQQQSPCRSIGSDPRRQPGESASRS